MDFEEEDEEHEGYAIAGYYSMLERDNRLEKEDRRTIDVEAPAPCH